MKSFSASSKNISKHGLNILQALKMPKMTLIFCNLEKLTLNMNLIFCKLKIVKKWYNGWFFASCLKKIKTQKKSCLKSFFNETFFFTSFENIYKLKKKLKKHNFLFANWKTQRMIFWKRGRLKPMNLIFCEHIRLYSAVNSTNLKCISCML